MARTAASKELDGLNPSELVEDFHRACLSRSVDDRQIILQRQGKVFFQISGAGHEALLLALARDLKPGYDWFFPYYRDQALMIGLGMSPYQILLQAVGSSECPSSAGRQMPSHWGDRSMNVFTTSSPTGSQCLPAVGCAEGGRYISAHPEIDAAAHPDEVTYMSIGEGATSEGEFWESLNTTCTLKLPMLYVVADNGFAISVPVKDQSPGPISDLVSGFPGLRVEKVDGCDYAAVRKLGADVISGIRDGDGPCLIHATVTRPYSHSGQDTQSKYRTQQELEAEIEQDPITRMEQTLVKAKVLSPDEAQEIREDAKRAVAAAAKEALAAKRPDPADVTKNVFVMPNIDPDAEKADTGEGEVVPMGGSGGALSLALAEIMEADPRVRVFGEDVADAPQEVLEEVEGKGGVFGTTHGLQRRFGVDRCFNTPLAEANIVGRAVGQAARGLRPAPEIQFFDYIWPAMTQIKSEAATVRWRSNGTFTCPTVIRVPIGGYLKGGAIWHSQSGESIFTHIPGLIVMFPSRARDAAGLLRTAFQCEDPVLFLEHKHLIRQPYNRDPYPSDGYMIPLGRGDYVTRGSDLTIVTYGATVEKSRLAAEKLDASVEIIDLRCLVPWDQELVAESVARTSRVLVVHEDIVTSGFGGEIAAWIGENLFEHLDAPVSRHGALDCHVAYEPTLEDAILPNPDRIAEAARKVLEY
ncbi:MAG: dehydrogenase E1 component subunit alpha/beta [Actinobacteria bacterium]|nr:dehydrogenase E1 component subunit alpha/beta [Actinomycetota bacterium]